MDYREEMEEGEEELRRSEGNPKKHGPPPGMDEQVWRIDKYYLQYMLRMKARRLHYKSWSREENIRMEAEDFIALERLLHYRRDLVKKDKLLSSYLRTIAALQLDPKDLETPSKIEQALIKVVADRSEMGLEDYVYLTSYLANYATVAQNNKWGDYMRLTLIGQIFTIEAKYGTSWKEGQQWLAYRLLVNLAITAMSLPGKETWRGLSMDMVKDVGESATVFDWVEEVLSAYESRLKKEHRVSTLAYIRANSAFLQKDYLTVAKQLGVIGKKSFEFFGLNICQLRLMTYYELLYNHGAKEKRIARKLEPDARKTIAKMRDHLKDLDVRQGRKTTQLGLYHTFVDSFSALLTLTEKAETFPKRSSQRFQYIFQPRIEQLDKLKDFNYRTGKWLRRQLKALE